MAKCRTPKGFWAIPATKRKMALHAARGTKHGHQKKRQSMIFIDCESAGLRGQIFAAAIMAEDGEVLFDGFYRHDSLKTNEWLRENVEPNLTGIEFPNRDTFLRAAAAAWGFAKERYGVGEYKSLAAVAHMGSPVGANFFQELFEAGLIGEFAGPYPLLDTAPLLLASGYDPDSEQTYAEKIGLSMPKGYKPHSALSDAALTRAVWQSLRKK